jgi:hypothetical protein
VLLLYIFWQVLDDDGIITGTVNDFVTLVVPLPNTKDHMLGEDQIDDEISSHEVGLNHQILAIINLVRN